MYYTSDVYRTDEGAFRDYKTVMIEDRDVIKQIWQSMDYFRKTGAPYSHDHITGPNKPFAVLSYPTDFSGADETTYEHPISLRPDGSSFWGIAPKAEQNFATPGLMAKVEQLIKQAEMFEEIEAGTERILPGIQEFIWGER